MTACPNCGSDKYKWNSGELWFCADCSYAAPAKLTWEAAVEEMARASYEASHVNYLEICKRGFFGKAMDPRDWAPWDKLSDREKKSWRRGQIAGLTALSQHIPIREILTGEMVVVGADADEIAERERAMDKDWS